MYVVRRPFRNFGKVLTPGTQVEPANIKRFKSRLGERDIIEVTEGTLDMWETYFVDKFGVSIKPEPEPEPEPGPEPEPEPEPKVTPIQPAKVVIKAK